MRTTIDRKRIADFRKRIWERRDSYQRIAADPAEAKASRWLAENIVSELDCVLSELDIATAPEGATE